MTQITKNFSLDEFKCPMNGSPEGEELENLTRLCSNLQSLRDSLGVPVNVISGYRSPEYNVAIRGAKKSQHMRGAASDLKVPGMEPVQVYEEILRLIDSGEMEEGGLGLYQTFVHYDVRGSKARWFGKGVKRR